MKEESREVLDRLRGREPDREEFEHAGFKCLILRHPQLRHLCGYVGIPKTHPYYGKANDEIPYLQVHGGITWSQKGNGKQWNKKFLWIGFDCAHAEDLSPRSGLNRPFEIYRDIRYVRREVKSLAEQLKEKED